MRTLRALRASVRRLGGAGERGSILPIIPVMALALLMIAGLVIDASRQLNARGQAVAFAEEAARAGAQAVRNEQPLQLDPAEARANVGDYCAGVLARGYVTQCGVTAIEPAAEGPARPLVVVVRVQTRIPATLLGMVGVRMLTAAGEGRAEPVEGDLVAPVTPTTP
ncbi:pilus assembly protein TadG-related protein [Ornithinimicrobium tianjinense]|uniref:pilus assembly protein TadG-related protein n=1 Tax=Ornithinimicrobium tianjinense TaxID=1195761 RepID=UPI00166D88D6|nr:pilus assembly protein TadG-related protein [Ornithinimicrobium tianjinense]